MAVDTSVETFDPTSQIDITMTDRAVAHVLEQRRDGSALRLSLTESGCSGYMYVLDFVAAPAPDDQRITISPELTLYVAAEHLALLRGTRIDYVKEGLNSLLKFSNPNAQSECGCGESFSIDSDLPD